MNTPTSFSKTIAFLFIIFSISLVFAQAPNKMSYQAVIRNSNGNLVVNSPVSIKVSIVQGSATGTSVYEEFHSAINTNTNGLLNLEIGTGTNLTGNFSTINWANGPFFIRTDCDPNGGVNLTISGVHQLLSVPFAMYAAVSGNGPQGAQGPQGPVGPAGNGINSIVSNTNGTLTVNYTNGSTYTSGSLLGPQGVAGPQGPQGVPGQIGATGPQGAIGPQGVAGPQGPQGVPGPTGLTGPQGPQGVQGVQGASGYSGPYFIGKDTLGGIVFYIYKGSDNQQHGFIVSKTETNAVWQSPATLIGASSSWNGPANFNLMTNSAAKNWVQTNFNSLWYLPSLDEMMLLHDSKVLVNKALSTGGFTVVGNVNYWSSTENVASKSYRINMLSGAPTTAAKTGSLAVRAIRAF